MTSLAELAVCRACLSSSYGMYKIADTGLQQIFEEISKMKFTPGDGRPQNICYICYSLLQKFNNFVAMAQSSERMFRFLLGKGIKITKHTVFQLNPRKPNLCFSRLKPISINNHPKNPEAVKNVAIQKNTYAEVVQPISINHHPNNPVVVKKEVIAIDKDTYAEVVEMSDIMKDFEHTVNEDPTIDQRRKEPMIDQTQELMIDQTQKKIVIDIAVKEEPKTNKSQNCDISMDLEYTEEITMKEGYRNYDSSLNQQVVPNNGDNEHDDCFIIETKEQPIVIHESDMRSENEETPLNEKESIRLEGLLEQPLAKRRRIEQCVLKEQIVVKKEPSFINNNWVSKTEETNANEFYLSLKKDTSIKSDRSILRPRDLGTHRADFGDVSGLFVPLSQRTWKFNSPASTWDKPKTLLEDIVMKNRENFFVNDADTYQYYLCEECFQSFSYRSKINHHIKKVHQNRHLKVHECGTCNYVFELWKDLKEHMVMNHPNRFKHPCNRCNKKYHSLKLLLIHKRRDHLEPIFIYSCNTCKKKYVQRLLYKYHILFVHPTSINKGLGKL